MATNQDTDPTSGDRDTHLGQRGAAPASSASFDTGATQLGRRGSSGVPAPETGNTQFGRRQRPVGTPRASAGTQLGQRRRAGPPVGGDLELGPRTTTDDPAPAEGTQLEARFRVADEPAGPTTGGTQLGQSRAESADTGLGQRAEGAAAEVPVSGATADAPGAEDPGVVRFGPGVPRAPASSPEWSRPTIPPARKKRRRPWVGALITIGLVGGVLAWLLTRVGDPVQAHAQQVAASSSPGACDTVVDVVGTIATNGRPGSVTYQWIRNDGQPTDVLTQTVAGGATSTQVHLQWSFSGHGRFNAVATLRVLEPAPASDATGAFTYSCS